MTNKFIAGSQNWFLFLQMVSLLLLSCSDSSTNQRIDNVKSDNKDSILRKPFSSFSDTITIDFPAAVFYNPDSLQLEKIKAITDTMIFESTMHDCLYQQRYSRIVLLRNWPKIKIIEIRNVRYILFKPVNECIDLNNENDPCGIFIFDGRKKSRLVDMTNIDSELGRYYTN